MGICAPKSEKNDNFARCMVEQMQFTAVMLLATTEHLLQGEKFGKLTKK